jgi:hypothetical protein
MLRLLVKHTPIGRLTRGVPVAGLLSAAQVARLARDHVAKLDPGERRRLLRLIAKLRRGTGTLSDSERRELGVLVTKLEAQAFAGSALAQLSPVPLPKRLLQRPKGKRRV